MRLPGEAEDRDGVSSLSHSLQLKKGGEVVGRVGGRIPKGP